MACPELLIFPTTSNRLNVKKSEFNGRGQKTRIHP